LGCDGGDEDDGSVAVVLSFEGVNGELSCPDWMGDVDFKGFVGVGGSGVFASLEAPEIGPSLGSISWSTRRESQINY